MDSQKKTRRWFWKFLLLGGLVLAMLIAFTLREPDVPYRFLRGQKVLHSRVNPRTMLREIIVQGSYEKLAAAAINELGRPTFNDGEFCRFQIGEDRLELSSAHPLITSIDPHTNKATQQPKTGADETVEISYTLNPSVFEKVRMWFEALFPGSPAQKGTPGGSTLPPLGPE